MFDWIQVAVLFLQLANKIVDWKVQQDSFSAGQQDEVARVATEVLRKTEVGRAILTRVGQLTDAQLDDELRSLEPPTGSTGV